MINYKANGHITITQVKKRILPSLQKSVVPPLCLQSRPFPICILDFPNGNISNFAFFLDDKRTLELFNTSFYLGSQKGNRQLKPPYNPVGIIIPLYR